MVCLQLVLYNSLRWRHNGHDGVSNHQPHDHQPQPFIQADQRKHQGSASLAFARGPVNSPHKWPVTRNVSIWWRHHMLSTINLLEIIILVHQRPQWSPKFGPLLFACTGTPLAHFLNYSKLVYSFTRGEQVSNMPDAIREHNCGIVCKEIKCWSTTWYDLSLDNPNADVNTRVDVKRLLIVILMCMFWYK